MVTPRVPPGERKKLGRHSTYTEAIGEEICRRIAAGETLVNICKDSHLPEYITVIHWRIRVPDFGQMYAQARIDQADTVTDEITNAVREEPERDEFGKVDSGAVQHKRLLVDTLKWRAAKLGPKTYGDKVQQEHTGPDGGPIVVSTGVPMPMPPAP